MSRFISLPKDILIKLLEEVENRTKYTNEELVNRITLDNEELRKREENKGTHKYYRHSDGCGSGRTTSYIRIENTQNKNKNNENNQIKDEQKEHGNKKKVEIYIDYNWMGSKRLKYKMIGTLFPISNHYNIIKIESFDDGKEVQIVDAYFDTYIFNETLNTEWAAYPFSDIPISLYLGNGCSSTEKFQLHLSLNTFVQNNIPKHGFLTKIIKVLNGLKYETIEEKEYREAYL